MREGQWTASVDALPVRPAEVLIVDDVATTRLMLSSHIQQLGHHVATAGSGPEALEMLARRDFDLVLLDVLMPEMDGFTVLERMKTSLDLRSIPIIMVSGIEDFQSVLLCIERGAEDYLHKPFDPILLKARVGASLEKKRLWDELKDSYRQLQELGRLQECLTQMIVHDLRTPLTSLLTGLWTLEETGNLDEFQKEVLGMAVTGSRKLLGMINDLLDISKLESGSLQLEYEAGVGAREIIEEAMVQVASLAQEKNLRVRLDVPDAIPFLYADREKLERVLVNLLGNAIKFSPQNGTITLSARQAQDSAEMLISVADCGEGIPAEAFERIFEKFGQVETRKAGREKSTGLGLTFCKLVTEAHGGRIWIESEIGQGSTFSFTIPLERVTSAAGPADGTRHRPGW